MPASYDYVVIGGGTGGLTAARRLAECHSVAVIEAGGLYELDNGNFTQIPADASYYSLGKDPAIYSPLIDWRQKTTPQAGFDGVSVYYPQGRALAGGSSRNFMWYQRGSPGSYHKWADAVGDPTYTFANFLPCFQKSVKFTEPNQQVRAANALPKFDFAAFSPSGGPLQVSYPNFAGPAAALLSRGLVAIGLVELPICEPGAD
ncbi:hypothetical protein XANCAGTX0491_007871 [Xanthoria calcicola]